MRFSQERRQWEHTDEEESLHGFAATTVEDMPPSLRREFAEHTKRVSVLLDMNAELHAAVNAMVAALQAWPCPAGCAPGNHRCDWCHGDGRHPKATEILAALPLTK